VTYCCGKLSNAKNDLVLKLAVVSNVTIIVAYNLGGNMPIKTPLMQF
jgi:hypothetical protein